VNTGKNLVTFQADSPICACAITPNGHTVIAGDAAGRVHFLCIVGL
jgi:hypothetical protein